MGEQQICENVYHELLGLFSFCDATAAVILVSMYQKVQGTMPGSIKKNEWLN